MPDLFFALVNATALARPVLQTRPHPPTHTKCWGGFICQLRPRWRERPHFVARWCHQLRPPRWHRLLPPSYPLLFLVTWYVLHQGEGPPIHSECLLHHGTAHGASHVLVVYVGVMALVLPIKWSLFFASDVINLALFFAGDVIGLVLFFAGDVIGLMLPTNLLVMDGIKPGGEEILFLALRDSLFSSSLVLRKTVFLTEVYFFLSSLFYLFWLIVTSWCIILLLHPLPCSLRVSPSVSAFSLHLPEFTILSSVGGCYRYGVDRP